MKRRNRVLIQAAEAFRDAGESANESRLTRTLVLGGDSQLHARYFQLLLRRDPAALTALAASLNAQLADAALNYTVDHGSEAQALAGVANRGQSLTPVWRPASASLVQTYFAGPTSSPIHLADFNQSLAPNATIGARLASPANPAHQLTGDIFSYYASRFGIFLATVPHSGGSPQTVPDAEDFLPAELEGSPASPTPYLNLARTYAEAHNLPAAMAEYNHALELSPSDAAIEDEVATTLYSANRHDDALIHWRQSLAILSRMQQHATYPESWFRSLERVIRHLGEYHLVAACRPEIEAILGPYLAKNGNYRSNELLRATYRASATSAEGASFILAVSTSAADANQILEDLSREPWLAENAREAILLRQIELVRNHPQGEQGPRGLQGYQYQLIELYLGQNRIAKARTMYNSLSDKDRGSGGDVDGIILAVRTGRLQALLDTWRANPNSVPKDAFGAAVYRLMKPTAAYKPDLDEIRPLEEFIFEYKRQNDSLVATDFLALAQLRLDTGDLPGGLDLLRQVTLQPVSNYENGAISFPVPGQPGFQSDQPAGIDHNHAGAPDFNINTDYAASLLVKNHHPAEATPFLQSLVRSAPWDATYRLRLAQAEVASHFPVQARADLLAVARDASAPYELRVQAAHALAPLTSQPTDLGSQELALLAHSSTIAAARQPYFAEARLAAAAAATTSISDRELLLREAIAIEPDGADINRARLDLILLQPTTADPSATLAILRSVQNTPPADSFHSNPVGDGMEADTATDGTPDRPSPAAHGTAIDSPEAVVVPAVLLPPPAASLELSAKIRLATQIASANQRDGNLEFALAYAELAVHLAKDFPQSGLTDRRDELKTAVLLERRNRLRRPYLHDALAQRNQVRPRLTTNNREIAQEESR